MASESLLAVRAVIQQLTVECLDAIDGCATTRELDEVERKAKRAFREVNAILWKEPAHGDGA